MPTLETQHTFLIGSLQGRKSKMPLKWWELTDIVESEANKAKSKWGSALATMESAEAERGRIGADFKKRFAEIAATRKEQIKWGQERRAIAEGRMEEGGKYPSIEEDWEAEYVKKVGKAQNNATKQYLNDKFEGELKYASPQQIQDMLDLPEARETILMLMYSDLGKQAILGGDAVEAQKWSDLYKSISGEDLADVDASRKMSVGEVAAEFPPAFKKIGAGIMATSAPVVGYHIAKALGKEEGYIEGMEKIGEKTVKAIDAVDIPFTMMAEYNNLTTKPPGELTEEERRFLEIYTEELPRAKPLAEALAIAGKEKPKLMGALHILNRIRGAGGSDLPFTIMNPSDELREAYFDIVGTGEYIAESMRTPLGALMLALPPAYAMRAGLLTKAGLLATRGTRTAKVAATGMKVTRAAILPVEMFEKAIAWPFLKLGKKSKEGIIRMRNKWHKVVPEQEKPELSALFTKINNEEVLTDADIALARKFDDEFADALEETRRVPEKEVVIEPEARVAAEAVPEKPIVEPKAEVAPEPKPAVPEKKQPEKPYAKKVAKPVEEVKPKPVAEVKPVPEEFSKLDRKGVLARLEETGETIATNDMDFVTAKVGNPAKGLDKNIGDRRPVFVYRGIENKTVTDGYVLIEDKDVAEEVLGAIIRKKKAKDIRDVVKAGMTQADAEAHINRMFAQRATEGTFPDTKKLFPENLGKELKLVGTNVIEYTKAPVAYLSDGMEGVAVDANKLAFMRKHLPDAKMWMNPKGKTSPVVFTEGGKQKGLLMPMYVQVPEELIPTKAVPKVTPEKPVAKVKPTEAIDMDDYAKYQEAMSAGDDIPKGAEGYATEVESAELKWSREIMSNNDVTPENIRYVVNNPLDEAADDVYTKIFNMESYDDTMARLFPEGDIEAGLARAMRKVPGAKGVTSKINPTITPRETGEAKRAQEAVAVFLDRGKMQARGRGRIVEDIGKGIIPDTKKLFKADRRGAQYAFKVKPEYEEAAKKLPGYKRLGTTSVDDVWEHPYMFKELPEETHRWMAHEDEVIKHVDDYLSSHGIDLPKRKLMPGERYSPRVALEAHGETIIYPSARPDMPRSYKWGMEGITEEILYSSDSNRNLGSYVEWAYKKVARNEFKKTIDAMGRTAAESIPESLRTEVSQSLKRLNQLSSLKTLVPRVKRGEKLHPSTIKKIQRIAPDIEDDFNTLAELTGKAQAKKGAEIIKNINGKLPEARLSLSRARSARQVAMKIAQQPKMGKDEATTRYLMFKSRIFPKEVAKVLDDFIPQTPGGFTKFVMETSQYIRTSIAAGDFSQMFLQGIWMLGRRPDKWATTAARGFRAIFDEKWLARYWARPENIASRLENPRMIRAGTEFYEGMDVMAKLGAMKFGLPFRTQKAVLTPFERFFTSYIDIGRNEMLKALKPVFAKKGEQHLMGTYVNRMFFVMDSSALGIHPGQRAIESGFVMFAPRYTRAGLAFLGQLFQGGVTGVETRRSVAQFIAGGMAVYLATCKALDKEPNLDPSKPTEFATLEIGNRRIGLGGIFYALFKMTAYTYTNIERGDIKSLDDLMWPMTGFYRSRMAPAPSLAIEAWRGYDYLGRPFETPQDWAYWAIGEHMLPIAAQEFIHYKEAPPTNPAAALIAAMVGMRVYPIDEVKFLTEKYTQKDFENFFREDKETGRPDYSKPTAEFMLLKAKHPEIQEAYDTWREEKSKRWKARHGLL